MVSRIFETNSVRNSNSWPLCPSCGNSRSTVESLSKLYCNICLRRKLSLSDWHASSSLKTLKKGHKYSPRRHTRFDKVNNRMVAEYSFHHKATQNLIRLLRQLDNPWDPYLDLRTYRFILWVILPKYINNSYISKEMISRVGIVYNEYLAAYLWLGSQSSIEDREIRISIKALIRALPRRVMITLYPHYYRRKGGDGPS